MAIFLSTMCLAVGAFFLSDVIGDAFRDILLKVIVLLSAAAFVFFVGLIDDIKTTGLRARTKFLGQMAALSAAFD